jgi:predicted deacylase
LSSPQEAGQTDAVDPNQTYSYEQLLEDSNELARLYPGLVDVSSIGRSVEGRDIILIKLGKGNKKILLVGAHHAREYMTSTFLMETVDEYARAYASNGKFGGYDIKKLLNDVTVYIVPMVNPDGVNLVQNGPDSVKEPEKVKTMRMLQDGYDKWKANINGVDLNRQYPCHWEEKESTTDVPSSEMYKGTAPATEPEVRAVMQLCKAQEFILAVSFHTKGEVIYWADSGTQEAIAAGSQIAQTLNEVSGYELMPVSGDPSVYGAGFENWFRQDFKRPAFCIELTPAGNGSTSHDDASFDELVWDKAKYLCAVLIQQADEPGL